MLISSPTCQGSWCSLILSTLSKQLRLIPREDRARTNLIKLFAVQYVRMQKEQRQANDAARLYTQIKEQKIVSENIIGMDYHANCCDEHFPNSLHNGIVLVEFMRG